MLRKLLILAAITITVAACEKKPSDEEIARKAAENSRVIEHKASPTPKPGDWMRNKDRKTPLDEKARK